MKILVIDDAQYILDNIAILLGIEGYDVETASDGVEGVDKAFAIIPDLILCDISMPRMDGFEVLKAVRDNPATSSTPFIFLSAFANIREGMNLGSDDYIVKPFTRNVLLASIKARMERRKQEETKVQDKFNTLAENVVITMPHEFRTVLNEILNATFLLKECKNSQEYDSIDELTDMIVFNVRRMQKITDNFVLMTKVQSYKRAPNLFDEFRQFKTDNPSVIVKDIVGLISSYRERQNDTSVECPDMDISLNMFSEHFYKCCYELIDNAFAYSAKGSKVNITTQKDEMLSQFIVKIVDHGRGMSKEQINDIYAFRQIDRKDYEQQGVGLGLMLAKELVQLYGGKFEITSEKDEGTTVILHLRYELIPD